MLLHSDYTLTSLSPLDGRYHSQLADLSQLFSEFSLIKYRVIAELKYLLFLSEKKITPNFSKSELKKISSLLDNFSLDDAQQVKKIEKETNHDVKAVEYFLRDFFLDKKIGNAEYLHFALTSEDTNSLAYGLMLQHTHSTIIQPKLHQILAQIAQLSRETSQDVFLTRTHGQPALPSTIGKEVAVFGDRLLPIVIELNNYVFSAKISGAVGAFNAHTIAYPKQNWPKLSTEFLESLQLLPSNNSTQIINAETYTEYFSHLLSINAILLDFNQDMWRYISDGIFLQKTKAAEVGSSTMPQKVNPIDFENSEGNLGLANALNNFFIQKLPISRLQRDLSDSTVKRNFGVALGYSLLAYNSLIKGLGKIQVNRPLLANQLNEHWEIVTEALQIVLKTKGEKKSYEALRDFSRGKTLNQKEIQAFIEKLSIDASAKNELKSITPANYIGVSQQITDESIARISSYLQRNS